MATLVLGSRALVLGVSAALTLVSACSSNSSSSSAETACTATGTQDSQFVADTFLVPESKTDYAIDENGDGTPDNALGQVLQYLTASGLDAQTGVNDSITAGELTLLVDEKSTDATFQTDTCASTAMELGTSTTMMAPVANQTFTVDSSSTATDFSGPIAAGVFTSQSQLKVTTPTVISLKLELLTGTDPLDLVITGAQIHYTHDSSGKLTGGQLNGVIKNSDLQGTLVPGLATILTEKVQKNLGVASTNMMILKLFDTGGTAQTGQTTCTKTCVNPDGSCAVAGDGKIDTCEVSTSFVAYVLVPDVQMYDGTTWKPSSTNGKPDSFSVGIAFTAIPAKF